MALMLVSYNGCYLLLVWPTYANRQSLLQGRRDRCVGPEHG